MPLLGCADWTPVSGTAGQKLAGLLHVQPKGAWGSGFGQQEIEWVFPPKEWCVNMYIEELCQWEHKPGIRAGCCRLNQNELELK